MGAACGMHGGEETLTGFRYGALKERDLVKDIGVDARIILKWI